MNYLRKKKIQLESDNRLAQCLTAMDLFLLGVGAIIGAGIFVLTGVAAATQAGPGIVLSYVIAGLACAFAALSYAELAVTVGGCGSAYGYAYSGFGELIAWIVGWDLLLEYGLSVAAVSAGWSGYFNDFWSTLRASLFNQAPIHPETGHFNGSAFFIVILLSFLLMKGVRSSVSLNNVMVTIKLLVILLFIVIAIPNVNPINWSPFLPFGPQGVIHGASLIFFAYIGFDAVSTAAEEAKNPQRDLPKGILGALIVCTLLYIIVSALLTGIAPYNTLNVASPMSHALLELGYHFVTSLIALGAIAGLTTVMLVLYYGLTRVFFAMARDGLLPSFFAVINPRTKTPLRIIVFCGIIIATTAGFLPIQTLAELVNVGTLFAFIVVCVGVIVLRVTQPRLHRPFKTPLMPFIPLLGVLSCTYLLCSLPSITLLRFIIWLGLGLIIYGFYSRHHSQLNCN